MRKLMLVAVLFLVLGTAPALADGPSGSREENADGTYDNEVSCGSGTATPVGGVVYVGANGAEVCNDGGTIPIQGRVIATTDQGGYVAVDGDANNPGQSAGWARVDGQGVRCGDDAGRRDATHPGSEDTVEDCG
jgi:hypothetical protein